VRITVENAKRAALRAAYRAVPAEESTRDTPKGHPHDARVPLDALLWAS
jgi:hypothetical protein